ncbi:MAG: HlyD family efflux transporter periplasmic adaptor subunit [Pseudomonadota bacterium]
MARRGFAKKNNSRKSDLKKTANIVVERGLKSAVKKHAIALSILIAGMGLCLGAFGGYFIVMQAISVNKTLQVNGTLRAVEQSIPVSHDLGGTIQTLFVTEGEVVREGQIIASFETKDIQDELRAARQDVAFLLLRTQCLKALKAEQSNFVINETLKQAMGKLQQVREMNHQIEDCSSELRMRAFNRAFEQQKLRTQNEIAKFSARRAQTAVLMHEKLGQSSTSVEPDLFTELKDLVNLDQILKRFQDAKRDQIKYETLRAQLEKSRNRFFEDIQRELRLISERLVFARSELSRMEVLLSEKFIYASASGRVQRLRVNESGRRVAAGAYILEIAPLKTDFEIIAESSIVDLPDVTIGQTVYVKLSGGLPKPIWVPAKIDRILELSQNKRQLLILLEREDLNKRDLLWGDHSLNGLGENSNALISVSSQSAWQSLGNIFENLIEIRLNRWRNSPQTA